MVGTTVWTAFFGDSTVHDTQICPAKLRDAALQQVVIYHQYLVEAVVGASVADQIAKNVLEADERHHEQEKRHNEAIAQRLKRNAERAKDNKGGKAAKTIKVHAKA